MELWSLMHFLMPDIFASHSQARAPLALGSKSCHDQLEVSAACLHDELSLCRCALQFRDWFCNPLTGMVEGSEAYNKVEGGVGGQGAASLLAHDLLI
jgi:hypothetical protein